ncbi:uncharacterized protein N7482_008625 [Penicillium canariense]|uniref:Tyrosine specific protein phosphatases domain-containing protein n=1 Tax=Penicillium canariense TaxID=189055 RepID=A0A9W9LJ62_9EURO|nr:uncharacterized protein N7482_008625 [Penicillium canariense]KAJ5157525.1 hypothetical protein N7482_008625 [Penicillium canariense]
MARQSSIDLDSPDRPFDNIINFRDVGRTINHFCGAEILKEGILFRSARLDDASERDTRRLADELHLKTVIDLRSQTEHQMATRKRRAEIANAGETPSTIDLTDTPVPVDADEHILQIPDSQRSLISLTGKAFERALLGKLDWFSYLHVVSLALTGYRADAIKIIGETVMQPRGLIGLGQDTLDVSMAEFRAIFSTLADEAAYPVLVHCTQGKDRTGIVILLALLLAGENGRVPADAMADDYARSELELVPEFEERMREIRVLGLGADYTRCPPNFVEAMTGYLDRKYGGVREYLAAVGVDGGMQEQIRQNLLIQS